MSCCIVTKITLINCSTGEGKGPGPLSRTILNILHEMVHFGTFYAYNRVLGVELPARSRAEPGG